MLFAIVIIFVLCHALRIILNVNTLFRYVRMVLLSISCVLEVIISSTIWYADILNIVSIHPVSLDTIRASINNGCAGEPLWVMIATSLSQFFITVNASINFFIYCFMCEPFRVGLLAKTKKLLTLCLSEEYVRYYIIYILLYIYISNWQNMYK